MAIWADGISTLSEVVTLSVTPNTTLLSQSYIATDTILKLPITNMQWEGLPIVSDPIGLITTYPILALPQLSIIFLDTHPYSYIPLENLVSDCTFNIVNTSIYKTEGKVVQNTSISNITTASCIAVIQPVTSILGYQPVIDILFPKVLSTEAWYFGGRATRAETTIYYLRGWDSVSNNYIYWKSIGFV